MNMLSSRKRMYRKKVTAKGGPFDGKTLFLWDPRTGTLPFNGGRYIWKNGYLFWVEINV